MRLDMMCDACKDHMLQKIRGSHSLEMDPDKKTLTFSDKDNAGMLELNRDRSIFKALVSEALLEGLSEEETDKYHENFGKDGIESFLREAECDHLVTDRVISFMKSLQVKNRSKYLEAMSNDDMMKILDRDADTIAMLLECSGSVQKDALLAMFSLGSLSKDAAEGKDSQKDLGWLSDDSFLKFMLSIKDSPISFHRHFTDKQIKDLIIRLATIAADERSKKLLPFSYSKNNGGLFSIRAFCPLSYMSPPQSYLDYRLDQDMLEAIIQLKHRVDYYQDVLELSITIDNARCKVSPLPSKDSGKGCHNLCRLLIELEPVLNDKPGSIHSLKAGKSTSYPASSFRCYKWVHYLGEREHNVGYFDWALCQMDTGHPAWKGCWDNSSCIYSRNNVWRDVVFSDDIYGEPLTWRIDKSNRGKEISFAVKTSVWVLSIPYPSSGSLCVLHCSFSDTVPMEL